MNTIRRLMGGTLAALVIAAAAQAAEWTDNYAAAVAQAKKEHKVLLLNFTGSDWCIWCKRTDKEVFDTDRFKDFADKKLVLVTVDFPESKPISDTVKAQNGALKDKYAIEGFPTLIALSEDEKVLFTQVGYKDGGPDALIAQFPK